MPMTLKRENQGIVAEKPKYVRANGQPHDFEWSTCQMDGREIGLRLQLHRRALAPSSRPACRSLDFIRAYAWLAGRGQNPRFAIFDVIEWSDRLDPQQIRVAWTRCHLGGARPWIHCACGRRVARLFKGLAGYCCRQCFDNPRYASQSKSTQGHRHFEACNIRLRLGGVASLTAPFPERPRGMHQKRYERLKRRAEEVEARILPRLRDKPTDYPNLVYYLPPQTSKRFRRSQRRPQ
jgi:hypothetical protein